VGGLVAGRVQADPAKSREHDINPGVGGIGVIAAAVKIAAVLARQDAAMAQEGDHGRGRILTDVFAAEPGFVDR
jgi:hypothetical protein